MKEEFMILLLVRFISKTHNTSIRVGGLTHLKTWRNRESL